MNWEEACQTLGIPVTATATEIHAQYVYRVQLLHPDKTLGLPEQARKKAEDELKLVNAAYSVLKDPKNNNLAIPPKLRVSPTSIRFTEVRPGQTKGTRIHIESIGGTYTKFWMADSPSPWLSIAEVKSTTKDPLPLEVTIEATGSGSSEQRLQCDLPVRIENEKTKTRDEVAIKIEMVESRDEAGVAQDVGSTPAARRWSLSSRSKALLFSVIPVVAGVVISGFLNSLIPLGILLAFSISYLTEKWFASPSRKYNPAGIFYRILLNLGILSYIGFVVWSAVKLFSRQFMTSPLIGSLVFLGECLLLVWLWSVVGRNSWRRPSMKLTIAILVAAFLIFSFAGVEPMATYKNNMLSPFSSPSTEQTQPMSAQRTAAAETANVGLPLAPSDVVVTALDSTDISVSWTDNSGGKATFYVTDTGPLSATVPAGTTTYTFSGVVPHSYHCFTVKAINSAGSSGWTTYVCTSTP